jgi:hypothetical protein
VDGDARSFRVALVAGELVNPAGGGLDALAVLEDEDWGAIQLPAADYPADVAGPLLDQAAEQAEEFARNGYRLAVVGGHPGLAEALARHGVPTPPALEPADAAELRAFLASAAG